MDYVYRTSHDDGRRLMAIGHSGDQNSVDIAKFESQ